MTTTTETLPITMEPEMNRRPRTKRKSFREVRESERARYEPLMQELADEINKLRDELDAERATLATIRGSLLSAIKYHFRGNP